MYVSSLNIFPVKSLRGVALEQSVLTKRGLVDDRLWMVTDANYGFITQRQIPKMATIEVDLCESALILSHLGKSPLIVKRSRVLQHLVCAQVWADKCAAFDEGEQASEWLTEILGPWKKKPLRLVRFDDTSIREVHSKYLQGEEAHATFADQYPLLITVTSSLHVLNDNLVERGNAPITMDRFRANVVVNSKQPFTEHSLDNVREISGQYTIGMRKACERCSITTTDQESGEIIDALEPIKTLRKINPQPNKKGAYFGQNATLLYGEGCTIKVGDMLVPSAQLV